MISGVLFRPVKGYEGLYEVSKGGWIRSMKTGKRIKPQRDYKNYFRVKLTKEKKRKWCRVHIVVAIAWIPNPDNKPEVNHVLGKKWDNRASQLEWMTRLENLQHARDNKIHRGKNKKKHVKDRYSATV